VGQSPTEGVPERRAVDVFFERVVDVVVLPGAFASFVLKAAEKRIGKPRMAMDGNSQDVVPSVKDILVSVAMMIIDVQDRYFAIAAEIGRGDRCRIEITESAERPALGMVARRPDEGIGQTIAFDQS
jgi:hypothetical protein